MNAEPLVTAGAPAGRLRLASPRTALVVGVAALLAVAAAVPLDIASHGISQGVVVLPFGVVGFVVARRQPRNPIGWILLALTLRVLALDRRRQLRRLVLPPGPPWAAARPRRRVSRGVVDLAAVAVAAADRALPRRSSVATLAPGGLGVPGGAQPSSSRSPPGRTRPESLPGTFRSTPRASCCRPSAVGRVPRSSKAVGAVLFVVFCVGCVVRQIVSYMRSAGEYRQQLKWLLSGGGDLDHRSHARDRDRQQQRARPARRWLRRFRQRRCAPARDRGWDLEVPAVRDRPADQPHRLLPDPDRAAGRQSSSGSSSWPPTCCLSRRPLASPPPPLRRRGCSTRCDCGCNASSIAASTAPATTPTRSSRRSRRGCRDAVDLDTVRGELLQAVTRAVQPAHASVWIRPPR